MAGRAKNIQVLSGGMRAETHLPEDPKARMVALLEANHTFPGPFPLTVVTVNDDAVVSRVRVLLDEGRPHAISPGDWSTRESRAGKYVSHRVRVHCQSAEDALGLYEILRGIEGVVTVM